MTGQDFERSMVHAFNDYANTYDKKLIAYRHIQTRYVPQLFDVHVDSRGNEFYLALECKSLDPNTVDHVYFKKAFNWKDGHCQVERETDWLNLSGRNGFLVVELRGGRGSRTRCFFVPWRIVEKQFYGGFPAIHQNIVTGFPCITKQGGKYTLDDDFVGEIINSLDSYPKSTKKAYRPKKRK